VKRLLCKIKKIDRKYLIQIPLVVILILSTITSPAAQSVTAAEADDILVSESSSIAGGCVRFYNDTVGFYVPSGGKWYLKNNQVSGWENYWAINFAGPSGSIAVSGDWNFDYEDSIGFYVPSQGKWYLKNNKDSGWSGVDSVKFAGPSGAIPVAGDWNDNGYDTPGFYVPSTGKWFLKDDLVDGWGSVTAFNFKGPLFSQPVTGDWDIDGEDTVGFYVPSGGKWYLKNNQISGWNSIVSIKWAGVSEAVAIAGDWDEDGDDTIGFYVPSGGKWYLKNDQVSGWSNYVGFNFKGTSGSQPITGDWDGNECVSSGVVIAHTSIDPGESKSVTATCPTGSLVTSGGYATDSNMLVYKHSKVGNGWKAYGKNNAGSSNTLMVHATCLYNVPAATKQVLDEVSYWNVFVGNMSGSTKILKTYAICLSGINVTVTKINEHVAILAGEWGTASPPCAAGFVTGGGFWLDPDLVVYNTSPNPGDLEWRSYAENPGSVTRTMYGYTECITFP